MSWIKRWKPRHVTIDPQHPEALGLCDDSGFVFNHKDLVKQMEWRGNRLQWTNRLVGRPFLDQPQEQFRSPVIKADPFPVKDPRLPQPDSDHYPPDGGVPVESFPDLEKKLNAFKWTAPAEPPIDAGDPDGQPADSFQEVMNRLNRVTWNS